MSDKKRRPPRAAKEQERLRVVLSSIGDAVVTTDVEGRVTFMNAVAESLTGWTSDESRGVALEDVFRIVNEESRRAVESPATRALSTGLIVGLANHTLLIDKHGVERPIDDSAAPLRDADGQITGVVLVFRDVSERRKAERALQQSEERFRALVESTRDYAIFMLDADGVVATWNPGARRIKGYEAHEIIGRHFSCFYPREAVLSGWPDEELRRASAEGRIEDEGWRVRKDGTTFWANVVITALRDEAGNVRGFSKITRDLTERRATENALRVREEQFRALTESANDAIVAADENGLVTFWNKSATTVFGYEKDEILGKPLVNLMPERYRDAHQSGIERLRASGESNLIGRTVELYGRRKDGAEFPLELSLSTWGPVERRTYCGIIRNISERRQLERAKLQAEAMAELDRKKDEFLAMLSHELRNPLSPILNAVHLLRLGEDSDPVQQEAKTIIERQVGHLTRLVDDLLEVSRITTGSVRLRREHCDFRSVVERAVDAARPLVDKHEHEFAVSIPSRPIWTHLDATRMEQVIVNLLANAAKYTDERGKISLTLAQENDEAVLKVRDSGVGITPELLPHVFDLFTQGERSLDRSQGGLGVGLTVVRRVVELHGGRVEASSAGIGRGSEFVVRVPTAHPPSNVGASSSQAPSGGARKLKVLVVDDNKDAADSAAVLLRVAGHEVRTAYAGRAALSTAQSWRPDAVLLDLGLPEIDGYEVARRLRDDPGTSDVRLIAVSGYGLAVDRARSREAGFDAHMVKPVDPRNVLSALSASAAARFERTAEPTTDGVDAK